MSRGREGCCEEPLVDDRLRRAETAEEIDSADCDLLQLIKPESMRTVDVIFLELKK